MTVLTLLAILGVPCSFFRMASLHVLTSKKELFLVSLIAGYCAVHMLMVLFTVWDFTTDDAYISWVYARQIASGNGLVWHDLVPRVEGYSNFLWVLISALVITLHLPLALTMKGFSFFSLLAGLFFLYRLGRLFVSPLLAILPVFIFSHYVGTVWWAVSGLESMLFYALAILSVWQSMLALGWRVSGHCGLSTGAWINTNIILLLLGLTRFEGVVWSIPVVLLVWCHLQRTGLKNIPGGMATLYKGVAITLGCFLLPYIFYYLWRWHYFGHWLPNSYLCKAFAPGDAGVVDLDYLRVMMPLLIASLPYFLYSKTCRHIMLWLPSLLYLLMLWHADTLLAYYARFFLAPLALFSLAAVLGVYQLFQYYKQSESLVKLYTCGVVVVFTVLFIPQGSLAVLYANTASYSSRNQNREAIAIMLNTQAERGASVLLGDCGIIPFNARADIRFIDSLCLNNAQMTQAPYNTKVQFYAQYVQAHIKPDWVIVHQSLADGKSSLLIDLLKQQGFFSQYRLLKTFDSGSVWPDSQGKKVIDYRYFVYKKK